MKTLKKMVAFCSLLAMMLILSNCAGTVRPAYHGGEDYDEKKSEWRFENTSEDERYMVRIKQEPGMHYMELNTGCSHSESIARRDQITILVKTWEENGWSSEEIVAPIKRTARWGGVQVVRIDEMLLRNIVLQSGVIINSTRWKCRIWDSKGHQYGVLNVGQVSEMTAMTPGNITIYYQPINASQNRKMKYVTRINNIKKDAELNGRRVDWVISIE